MDEKKKPAASETELPAAPLTEDETPESADGLPQAEENAENEEAAPDMVFGMKRRTFHLMVIGYALGAIVIGLLGIAGLVAEGSGTVLPGTVGAVLGYFLAKYLDRRDEDRASNAPKS